MEFEGWEWGWVWVCAMLFLGCGLVCWFGLLDVCFFLLCLLALKGGGRKDSGKCFFRGRKDALPLRIDRAWRGGYPLCSSGATFVLRGPRALTFFTYV